MEDRSCQTKRFKYRISIQKEYTKSNLGEFNFLSKIEHIINERVSWPLYLMKEKNN